jgi:FtsZ-interacting cell division protein ZipA
MDSGGIGWGLQTIVGATILIAVLLWALIRNRRSKNDINRTEQATRELYEEEEAHRDAEDDKVP